MLGKAYSVIFVVRIDSYLKRNTTTLGGVHLVLRPSILNKWVF